MAKPWNLVIEWITGFEGVIRAVKRVYAYRKTRFQEILVAELEGLGKSLVIDGKVQSSLLDEHWYHEALVHPIMLAHPNPRRVLILGGGEGATLREVLKHKTVERVVMVDIDREMVEIARQHLWEWHQGAFDDDRVEIVIMDGREYVEKCCEEFDVAILDLVDPFEGGPAVRLYTLEFYTAVRRILASNGVMVTQATSPILYPRTFSSIVHTLSRVYRIVRPYTTYVKSYNGLWGFAAASDKVDPASLTPSEVEERIRARVRGQLRFYDPATHVWLFTLPKPVRDVLDKYKLVSTDENPVYC